MLTLCNKGFLSALMLVDYQDNYKLSLLVPVSIDKCQPVVYFPLVTAGEVL